MAQLLAPYNNSMRLGQGFNSYTQQICLDQAVLKTVKPGSGTAQTNAFGLPDTASSSQPSDDGLVVRLLADSSANEGPESDPDSDSESERTKREREARRKKKQEQDTRANDNNNLIGFNRESREAIEGGKVGDRDFEKIPPWVKPQIVTYSSRFVDKISDVTNAMNVSGSLSIKTAQVGGKANGSYVDSDKFKSSDINFHLQVKVTNQVETGADWTTFNKLDHVRQENITEIYGDTFISGFETGGELNAVISVKVRDKSKIFEIKAGLEGELNTPTLAGKVEVKFGMDKNSLSRNTETTVAVNWSGGGSIKDPNEDWSIASLKKAAAAFPELVAMTPQRTYAILTKYTALCDYQKKMQKISPLEYENAGIYTGALLDSYMDYKAMWKQISHATFELKNRRAHIEMARPGEDVYALAQVKGLSKTNPGPGPGVKPNDQVGTKSKDQVGAQSADQPDLQAVELQMLRNSAEEEYDTTIVTTFSGSGKDNYDESDHVKFTVFQPSFAGLIAARKVCRVEMSKIVTEVDIITKDPAKATDTNRDAYFLNSLIFEQLLPIVRSSTIEDVKLGLKDANAPLLLGYVKPEVNVKSLPNLCILDGPLKDYDSRLVASFQTLEGRSEDYRLQGTAGDTKIVNTRAEIFNDLASLNATFRIVGLKVYHSDSQVRGIAVQYENGTEREHGACVGEPSHRIQLSSDGAETITELLVQEGQLPDKSTVITRIALATSACNVLDTDIVAAKVEPPPKDPKKEEPKKDPKKEDPKKDDPAKPSLIPKKDHYFNIKLDGQWSLRGFFGFTLDNSLIVLGVVWAKDTFVPVSMVPLQYVMTRNFIGLSPGLQSNLRRFAAIPKFKPFCEKFILGQTIEAADTTITAADGEKVPFNAMDKIDVTWRIRSIGFASVANKLRGLKVTYNNDREVTHGTWTAETEIWVAKPSTDLVVAKLTSGTTVKGSSERYIDTIEFVCTDADGSIPIWPFETSTLRYMGEKDERVTENVCVVMERAPRVANLKWSVRGFYGEQTGGVITSLGLLWGSG